MWKDLTVGILAIVVVIMVAGRPVRAQNIEHDIGGDVCPCATSTAYGETTKNCSEA